jgi:hypothetical protein
LIVRERLLVRSIGTHHEHFAVLLRLVVEERRFVLESVPARC